MTASGRLEQMMQVFGLKEVTVSAYGLREGLLQWKLTREEAAKDPLIEFASDWNAREARAPGHGEELFDWMTPLFSHESEAERRVRFAACLMSDVGWRRHPDDRALGAFRQILRGLEQLDGRLRRSPALDLDQQVRYAVLVECQRQLDDRPDARSLHAGFVGCDTYVRGQAARSERNCRRKPGQLERRLPPDDYPRSVRSARVSGQLAFILRYSVRARPVAPPGLDRSVGLVRGRDRLRSASRSGRRRASRGHRGRSG